jgi:hypothetical protein
MIKGILNLHNRFNRVGKDLYFAFCKIGISNIYYLPAQVGLEQSLGYDQVTTFAFSRVDP